MIRKNRFLRNFSIVLYIIMQVKLFAIDFGILSAGARTAVFMVLGLFFNWVCVCILETVEERRGDETKGRGGGIEEAKGRGDDEATEGMKK